MKAERRHELKTNTLKAKLENAPAFFKTHGSKILLGLTLCVLTAILVSRYYAGKSEKALKASESLDEAVFTLYDMRMSDGNANLGDLRIKVEDHVKVALDNSTDANIKATALILRGDAYWEAANTPINPAADQSQSATAKKSEDYLADAEKAYKEVDQPPLNTAPAAHAAVISARLGLAAIAENRSQFDEAKKYYKLIIDDTSADSAYVELAHSRLDALTELKVPIFLSKHTEEVPRIPLGPPAPAKPVPATPPMVAPSRTSAAPTATHPSLPHVPVSPPTTAPTAAPVRTTSGPATR